MMDQYDYIDDQNNSFNDSNKKEEATVSNGDVFKPASDSDSEYEVSLADQLVKAYFDYEDFVGSSYYKHCRLFKYHKLLCYALKDPSKLMYPTIAATDDARKNTEIMANSNDRSSIDSAEERAAALKENKPI